MKYFSIRSFTACCTLGLTFFIASCQAQGIKTVTLFGFESDADIAKWKISSGEAKRSPQYAVEGQSSIALNTPQWHHGMSEWPIWQVEPEVNDWSAYDRVLIDFVNPTQYAELVRFKAADEATSKIGSADWPAGSYSVQPRSHLRVILSLDTWFGDRLDRKNIRQFLIYTARAPHDYTLHVDHFTLLAPGQEPPPLPAAFRQQINDLRLQKWSLPKAETALSEVQRIIQASAQKSKVPGNKEMVLWANRSYAALKASLQTLRQKSASSELSTEEISRLGNDVDAVATRARRLGSLIGLRARSVEAFGEKPYALGWANSMQKVLPKDMPVSAHVARERTIELARNESESTQLVVVPFDRALKGCRIEFGNFTGSKGASLPKQSLDARVVGYVRTSQPEYEVDYVGWWPDPLLDFMPKVDIEPETAQTFWVRVRAPKNQQAGTYKGDVKIVAEGVPATTVKLTIKVHPFEMPDRSPLPLSNQIGGAEFFNKYSSEDWSTLKFKVTDFLSDYYINYDNMYRHGPPDFELLKRLRDQGRLSAFCLSTLDYTVFVADMDEAAYQKAFQNLLKEIESGYQIAKKENILQYAYLYGMDEVPPKQFPVLKRLTSDLKAKYPDLPILTTAMDFSYGESSGASEVDTWVPIIHEYTPEKAEKARAQGKKVWWYTCQSPAHPYPNIFTEYPLIDIRLLMGFMSAKMQPDGFLYYCMFRDEGPPRKAITTGPFTEWDARAFSQPYNGEGYLAYPGSDGRPPMASIRLENFRDGLEDYAYWKILEATTQKVRDLEKGKPSKTQKEWLKQADQLLGVPNSMVKSAAQYTKNPGDVFQYRREIADLLARAGTSPATPQWPTID